MIGLLYDCMYGCLKSQTKDMELFELHPQDVMLKLGLKYKKAVPQSMSDCWWFFGVEGDLENLPKFIKTKDFGDLSKFVGCGLSKEDVINLQGFYTEDN